MTSKNNQSTEFIGHVSDFAKYRTQLELMPFEGFISRFRSMMTMYSEMSSRFNRRLQVIALPITLLTISAVFDI